LQAFLVEMTFSSMTANVKRSLPLNKKDLYEIHVACRLALIHSNLQFKPTIWAEPSPESSVRGAKKFSLPLPRCQVK